MSERRSVETNSDGRKELEGVLRAQFAIVLTKAEPLPDSDRYSSSDTDATSRFFTPDEQEAFPYAASDLLDPAVLQDLLRQQSQQLGDVSADVVGTMFAKRYSVLIAGMFATYSVYDQMLSTSLSDLRIRLGKGGVMAYLTRLDQCSCGAAGRHSSVASKESFSSYINRIEQQMELVLQTISAATGASPKVLRSLVVHQVHMLYASLDADAASSQDPLLTKERTERIRKDRQLLDQPQHASFHAKFRLIESPKRDRLLLMRRYCCQAYQTPSHGYCETCPKTKVR